MTPQQFLAMKQQEAIQAQQKAQQAAQQAAANGQGPPAKGQPQQQPQPGGPQSRTPEGVVTPFAS